MVDRKSPWIVESPYIVGLFCKRALQNEKTPQIVKLSSKIKDEESPYIVESVLQKGFIKYCRALLQKTDTNKTSCAKQTCYVCHIRDIVGLFCNNKPSFAKQIPTKCLVQKDTNNMSFAKQTCYVCHICDIVGLFCSTDTNKPSFAKQIPTKCLVQNSPYGFVTFMIL